MKPSRSGDSRVGWGVLQPLHSPRSRDRDPVGLSHSNQELFLCPLIPCPAQVSSIPLTGPGPGLGVAATGFVLPIPLCRWNLFLLLFSGAFLKRESVQPPALNLLQEVGAVQGTGGKQGGFCAGRGAEMEPSTPLSPPLPPQHLLCPLPRCGVPHKQLQPRQHRGSSSWDVSTEFWAPGRAPGLGLPHPWCSCVSPCCASVSPLEEVSPSCGPQAQLGRAGPVRGQGTWLGVARVALRPWPEWPGGSWESLGWTGLGDGEPRDGAGDGAGDPGMDSQEMVTDRLCPGVHSDAQPLSRCP